MTDIEVEHIVDDIAVRLTSFLLKKNCKEPYFIGIERSGVWLAEVLLNKLASGHKLGRLNINYHRDDYENSGIKRDVQASKLPFDTRNRDIVLIDDVLNSGRTSKAALSEIFDFGRPNRVFLVVLFDLFDRRELPIQADLIGKTLNLQAHERVKLQHSSPLTAKIESS